MNRRYCMKTFSHNNKLGNLRNQWIIYYEYHIKDEQEKRISTQLYKANSPKTKEDNTGIPSITYLYQSYRQM